MPISPFQFSSLDEACEALLLTTAALLNGAKVEYVVAGGWVPIILGSPHGSLEHPGTRDVDILLVDDNTGPRAAADVLLAAGFRPSAKHEFQLLKDARVGGQLFVFNVDLMHPHESSMRPNMFADILDFGVKDNYDPRGSRYLKSIAFASAAIVVEQKLFETAKRYGRDFDGTEISVDVPFLNLTALLLSKCESVRVPKRTRDAFDIYFALTGPKGLVAAAELKALSVNFPDVRLRTEKLRQFLTDEASVFDGNVAAYLKPTPAPWVSPAQTVLGILNV